MDNFEKKQISPAELSAAEGEKAESKIALEIWFRPEKKDSLASRKLHTTIRLGDRTLKTSDPKGGYREGDFVAVKIQSEKDPAQFDQWQAEAVVISVTKKKISEIDKADLEELSEERKTVEGLKRKTRKSLRKRDNR